MITLMKLLSIKSKEFSNFENINIAIYSFSGNFNSKH